MSIGVPLDGEEAERCGGRVVSRRDGRGRCAVVLVGTRPRPHQKARGIVGIALMTVSTNVDDADTAISKRPINALHVRWPGRAGVFRPGAGSRRTAQPCRRPDPGRSATGSGPRTCPVPAMGGGTLTAPRRAIDRHRAAVAEEPTEVDALLTARAEGLPPGLHQTTWSATRSIESMRAIRDKPWLLRVNVYDPHSPFNPPTPIAGYRSLPAAARASMEGSQGGNASSHDERHAPRLNAATWAFRRLSLASQTALPGQVKFAVAS